MSISTKKRSENKSSEPQSLSPEEAARRIEASKNPKPAESIPDNAIDMLKAVEKRVQSEQATLPRSKPSFDSKETWKAYNLNETGDAWLYASIYSGKMLYDHAAKTWYVWEGNYWQEDKCEKATTNFDAIIEVYGKEASRLALESAKALEAGKLDKSQAIEAERQLIIKRIWLLNTPKRRESVLKFVRTGEHLGVSGDDIWDSNPMLLGCPNGVIDLTNGRFMQGQPEDYIKTIAKAEWRGFDEPCQTWERFISEIFDKDLEIAAYFQRLLGYSITGKSTEHIFPVLHGRGRNGKGTVLETLRCVLDDIAGSIPSETLLDQKQNATGGAATPDLMLLRGRRLVWASETSEGRRFNVGKVKWLCGGDTITGRHLFGKMASFSPIFTLFLLTNHKPKADNDYAFWKRVHLIPFELSFVDDPVKPFERKVDKGLPDKLKAEISGILAWLVRGCLEWQRIGLCTPDKVNIATSEYRKSEDTIEQFIDERCEVDLFTVDKETRACDLYSAYETWCKNSGLHLFSQPSFAKYLKTTLNIEKSRNASGVVYKNIALKPIV